MRHFNLETFAGGELSRQINRDIEAVMRNVVDPNTDVKAKRKITVTIEFKPNEQRNFITTNVNSKPTVAPALGAVTALGVQQDLTSGAIDVAEIGSKMPEATVKVEGKTVDTETGEIMEKGSKVVDFRNIFPPWKRTWKY